MPVNKVSSVVVLNFLLRTADLSFQMKDWARAVIFPVPLCSPTQLSNSHALSVTANFSLYPKLKLTVVAAMAVDTRNSSCISPMLGGLG